MGCLKLSYYEQGRALEVNPIFFTSAVEKKRYAEKNCLSSSTYGAFGYEKDDEVKGSGNHLAFGDYGYDPRTGRRWTPDAHSKNYPFISPYAFALNSPINVIDPDGKDVYLVVWFSKDGETGHAGIAVDNYKMVEQRSESGEITGYAAVPDGTVTYFDLWPKAPVGKTQLQKGVTPDYGAGVILNKADLLATDPSASGKVGNVSEFGERRAPDGVVSISSSYVDDVLLRVEAKSKISNNEQYNACDNNCSTFSQDLINTISTVNIDASQEIKPKGTLKILGYGDASTVAPNNLYNKATEAPGANVLKGPDKAEAKPYLEYFGKENRSE
jgi:hypothetical protein